MVEMNGPERDRPIRVLRLIARMNVGGPALQVVAMARLIDPTQIEQHVLSGSVAAGEEDYLDLRAPDVKVTKVPGLGRSVRGIGDLKAFVFVVREIRRFRPDIVHTHTAKAGVLGRIAAFALRVPVTVHTFHGHILHGYFSPRITKAVVLVEKLLAMRTTQLISVGERVRDELLAAGIGDPAKFEVVAPGVVDPVPPPRDAARKRFGIPGDRTAIFFVGRLARIKRAERFVELAAHTVDSIPNAVFVIVGDGPERAELERQAAPLGDRVLFAGWSGDMSSVYAAADLIVLTSDNEGMPVALIEAAMQGVPAVTTDVGSVRQVVLDGTSGTIVPVGDGGALAEAVVRLTHDKDLLRAYGLAARQHAVSKFSEQRLADDIAGIYQRLFNQRNRRGTS